VGFDCTLHLVDERFAREVYAPGIFGDAAARDRLIDAITPLFDTPRSARNIVVDTRRTMKQEEHGEETLYTGMYFYRLGLLSGLARPVHYQRGFSFSFLDAPGLGDYARGVWTPDALLKDEKGRDLPVVPPERGGLRGSMGFVGNYSAGGYLPATGVPALRQRLRADMKPVAAALKKWAGSADGLIMMLGALDEAERGGFGVLEIADQTGIAGSDLPLSHVVTRGMGFRPPDPALVREVEAAAGKPPAVHLATPPPFRPERISIHLPDDFPAEPDEVEEIEEEDLDDEDDGAEDDDAAGPPERGKFDCLCGEMALRICVRCGWDDETKAVLARPKIPAAVAARAPSVPALAPGEWCGIAIEPPPEADRATAAALLARLTGRTAREEAEDLRARYILLRGVEATSAGLAVWALRKLGLNARAGKLTAAPADDAIQRSREILERIDIRPSPLAGAPYDPADPWRSDALALLRATRPSDVPPEHHEALARIWVAALERRRAPLGEALEADLAAIGGRWPDHAPTRAALRWLYFRRKPKTAEPPKPPGPCLGWIRRLARPFIGLELPFYEGGKIGSDPDDATFLPLPEVDPAHASFERGGEPGTLWFSSTGWGRTGLLLSPSSTVATKAAGLRVERRTAPLDLLDEPGRPGLPGRERHADEVFWKLSSGNAAEHVDHDPVVIGSSVFDVKHL
jgi:hypothetical protein